MNEATIVLVYSRKCAAAVSGVGCYESIVMSSAYTNMCVLESFGNGNSCMNRSKMVSERTDSCGSPLLKRLMVGDVPL